VKPWQLRLFVELAVETEEGGSDDIVEQSDVLIKLPAEKIKGIPIQHPREDRYDIKADQDVIRLDLESAQYPDEILRIPHMVWGDTKTWCH